MLLCPRCQRLVEAPAHAACPHCATPLSPPSPSPFPPTVSPASAPLQSTDAAGAGSGRRTVRVSLTGEVLEDMPAPAAPNKNVYVPSAPGLAPPASRPLPPPSRQRETVPDNSDKKALVINLSVVFFLLAACAGAGGWYWTHRTNPKAQVTRYVHAIQWLDWGVVYDLSAPPPGNKSRREFLSMMDDKFDSNGVIKIGARKSLEQIPITIGEAQMHGDEATVVVTRGATQFSAAKSLPLTLSNYGGVWKIHPLAENPLDMMHDADAEKKAANALLQSLLQNKAGASGSGGQPSPR